jgi:hypothetical protein
MELGTMKKVKEILEISLNQFQHEREKETQCVEKLEQRLEEVFKNIMDNAQEEVLRGKENIQKIMQVMESYR